MAIILAFFISVEVVVSRFRHIDVWITILSRTILDLSRLMKQNCQKIHMYLKERPYFKQRSIFRHDVWLIYIDRFWTPPPWP